MKRTLALCLTLVMLVGLFAACGGGGGSSAPPPAQPSGDASATPPASQPETPAEPGSSDVAQDFIYAVDAEPAGLDPHLATAHASLRIHRNIYSRLTFLDRNLDLKPDLAERWEIGEDNTVTFFLRKGVQFHNGREMTADDVVYSYERILDEATGSVARSYFSSVEKVEALDDYTVKFTLSGPDATFMEYTANVYCAIVPKEVVEQYGDLNANTCGTGPFMMKEYIEGNQIVLEKNPNYFIAGEPQLDTLTYAIMADESARLNALRTGTVHLAKMSSTSLPLVAGNSEIVVMDYLSANYDYLGFNLDEGPCSDPRVRQALSMLVDRQEIIDVIYDGYAEPTGPVVTAMSKWAVDVSKNEFYQYDVEKAKALLTDAGYPDGFELEITAGITALTTDVATVLKSQFERGGLKVNLVVKESAQAIDDWRNRTHQSLISSNGGGNNPDRGIGFFFKSGASANVWGYSNPEIDRLADAGRTEMDEKARYDIYREAQEILLEDMPNLFLVSPKEFYFARDNVNGYVAETYEYDIFTGVSLG